MATTYGVLFKSKGEKEWLLVSGGENKKQAEERVVKLLASEEVEGIIMQKTVTTDYCYREPKQKQ